MSYSIDDQHGTNICGGIQLEHKAREAAQRLANESGEPVVLYSNEVDEGELVEPELDERHSKLGLHPLASPGRWRVVFTADLDYPDRFDEHVRAYFDRTSATDSVLDRGGSRDGFATRDEAEAAIRTFEFPRRGWFVVPPRAESSRAESSRAESSRAESSRAAAARALVEALVPIGLGSADVWLAGFYSGPGNAVTVNDFSEKDAAQEGDAVYDEHGDETGDRVYYAFDPHHSRQIHAAVKAYFEAEDD